MAEKLIFHLRRVLLKFEDAILTIVSHKLHPGFYSAELNIERQKLKFEYKHLLNEGFFWAVPKHRRSIEKRLSRKFGWPKYNWKPLTPKTNLLMCKCCGTFYESYTICGNCYEKIKEESKPIIEAIDNFKLEAINKEMIVLYVGDKELQSDEFWKGQRIVEISKKRPLWFHNNLLTATTQKLSNAKEIKPTDDLA